MLFSDWMSIRLTKIANFVKYLQRTQKNSDTCVLRCQHQSVLPPIFWVKEALNFLEMVIGYLKADLLRQKLELTVKGQQGNVGKYHLGMTRRKGPQV